MIDKEFLEKLKCNLTPDNVDNWTRDDQKKYIKLKYVFMRKYPLEMHLFDGIDWVITRFQAFIPYLYGKLFRKEQVWSRELRDYVWVDKE